MKKPKKPIKPTAPTRMVDKRHSRSLYSDNTLADVFLELPNGIDPKEVTFEVETNWDGHYEGANFSWTQEEPNDLYGKQLKQYEKGLVKYEAALAKYKADMVAYTEWLKNHEAEEKVKAIEFHKAKLRELED
jgi:hypothetical protein